MREQSADSIPTLAAVQAALAKQARQTGEILALIRTLQQQLQALERRVERLEPLPLHVGLYRG